MILTKKEIEEVINYYKDRFSDYEYYEKELDNLKKGIKVNVNSIIDVNDWGRARVIDKPENHNRKKIEVANLVIEEDGSVRWYINPNDDSDYTVLGVTAKYIGKR